MNEGSVERLFDEFALAYVRGERPDVEETLERAGRKRDELAALIDGFLQATPARAPSEEELVLMQAHLEQEPPLLVLRRRRALSRDAVVDALVRALALDPTKRRKVGSYYHELETGILEPEPVDRSVWDALSETLRANARALAGPGPTPLATAPAYRRKDEDFVLELREELPAAQPDEELDEVDRLFLGPEAT